MCSQSSHLDSSRSTSNWSGIEDVLDELAEASKNVLTATDFYRLLLERIVPSLGVSGGAIWTSVGKDELRLECHKDLVVRDQRDTEIGALLGAHQELAEEVLRTAQPQVVAPSASRGGAFDCWRVVHPVRIGSQTTTAIELVQRGEINAATARQYARVLSAVAEVTEDFHRCHELRELRGREQKWRQYDQFAERVHRSLDLRQTAFVVANEARRVIDCDRVSVLIREGGKCRVLATSGVDTLDRRAKVVQTLELLAARCVAAGDPVWYCDGLIDVAEEIERPLEEYLDESHARVLAVAPLFESPRTADPGKPTAIGALVAEQFQKTDATPDLPQRVQAVSGHCTSALANAQIHSHLPLSSIGRQLARLRKLAEPRHLPKTALAAAAIVATVLGLTFIPADFDIEARGELQPWRRRDVFASDDAVVSELLVDHAQAVKTDQPLVVLSKPQLDLEFRRVAGEIQTAEKKLASVQAQRLSNLPAPPGSRSDAHQLAADEEELKEQLKGLHTQREILQRERADLTVRSPLDGNALTWNLKQLLEARPVQRGQTLLTVGDLDGPWVAELHLADYRAGHVLAAREELGRELLVSFALSADPGTQYDGQIADMALSTELDEASSPRVLVTVDFDRNQIHGLHPGATVIAKIHCGRRAIGYVWLHDLFEAVQSHWWW